MGIITKVNYGQPIDVKDGEQIHVRLVDVETRTGVAQRIDVRVFVDRPATDRSKGYNGWSQGFQTSDPQVLRDLAASLLAAADDAEQRGVSPDATSTVQQVPVVPVTPTAPTVNTKSVAARKYQARKAAAANGGVGTSKPVARTRKSTK